MTTIAKGTLYLRRTYPGSDEFWHVVDEEGENIAVIADPRGHTGPGRPGWFWGISVFGLPQTGNFRGSEWSREAAMAKLKEWWPLYRAQYSGDRYEFERQEHHRREAWWAKTEKAPPAGTNEAKFLPAKR